MYCLRRVVAIPTGPFIRLSSLSAPQAVPYSNKNVQFQVRRLYSSDTDGNSPKSHGKRSMFESLTTRLHSFFLNTKLTTDHDLARLLSKSTSVAIYSIAGMTILSTIGIDMRPLLASISITGFAVGFALREVAANFLAGLFLVFSKPFERGSEVKVHSNPPVEGIVESIDVRYVVLKGKDGKSKVKVPSGIVYSNTITVTPPKQANAISGSNIGDGSSNSSNSSSSGMEKGNDAESKK